MMTLYNSLKEKLPNELQDFSVLSDELIFKFATPNMTNEQITQVCEEVGDLITEHKDIFRVEGFWLESIKNHDGYIKHIINTNETDYKCIPAEEFHIVIKELMHIPLTENDKVFRYNGKLAKYIE